MQTQDERVGTDCRQRTKWTTRRVRNRRIDSKQEVHEGPLFEAHCCAIVASRHGMRDSVDFVPIKEEDASGFGHDLIFL